MAVLPENFFAAYLTERSVRMIATINIRLFQAASSLVSLLCSISTCGLVGMVNIAAESKR